LLFINLSSIDNADVDFPLLVVPTAIKCLSNRVLALRVTVWLLKFKNVAKGDKFCLISMDYIYF